MGTSVSCNLLAIIGLLGLEWSTEQMVKTRMLVVGTPTEKGNSAHDPVYAGLGGRFFDDEITKITHTQQTSPINGTRNLVKRFFYVSQEAVTQGQKLQYTPKDKLPKVIAKANIMFWGHTLQGMTYDFMD
ncbi:hypothetical protein C8J56DRAFT_896467 [Mycena floridula]|nr:hypothetical protein C8J56DRAFT_896467 [Mycena floridula]